MIRPAGIVVALLIFGLASVHSQWLPKPKYNVLLVPDWTGVVLMNNSTFGFLKSRPCLFFFAAS